MSQRSPEITEHMELMDEETFAKRFWPEEPWRIPMFEILNDPDHIPADEVDYMRDEEVVIGVVHNGEARAYSAMWMGWYHTVNDELGGDDILVCCCDRCDTGQAYHRTIDGEVHRFAPSGIAQATMHMMDMTTRSHWHHHEGVCVQGEYEGTLLEPIPSVYRCTWKTWRERHPETTAPAIPDSEQPPGGLRSGHPRDEYFGREGMQPEFCSSVTGRPDHRLDENEPIVAVNIADGIRVYPLRAITLSDRVVNDTIGQTPLVVWHGPSPDDIWHAAFRRDHDAVDEPLEFEPIEGQPWQFRDTNTQTIWDLEGQAIEGELEGEQLEQLFAPLLRWHAYAFSHENIDIYEPPADAGPSLTEVADVVETLRAGGYDVEPKRYGEDFAVGLPNRTEASYFVRIDDHRFALHRFEDVDAAIDFAHFQDHTLRSGRYVIRDRPEPEQAFSDLAHSHIQRAAVTPWSNLLADPDFIASFESATADPDGTGTFKPLVQALEDEGYRTLVEDVGWAPAPGHLEQGPMPFLTPRELPPGGIDGIHAVIYPRDRQYGDNFSVYLFESAAAADAFVERPESHHLFGVDRFVFRSLPVDRWEDPLEEVGWKDDEDVSWSELLTDDTFRSTIEEHVDRLTKAASDD